MPIMFNWPLIAGFRDDWPDDLIDKAFATIEGLPVSPRILVQMTIIDTDFDDLTPQDVDGGIYFLAHDLQVQACRIGWPETQADRLRLAILRAGEEEMRRLRIDDERERARRIGVIGRPYDPENDDDVDDDAQADPPPDRTIRPKLAVVPPPDPAT